MLTWLQTLKLAFVLVWQLATFLLSAVDINIGSDSASVPHDHGIYCTLIDFTGNSVIMATAVAANPGSSAASSSAAPAKKSQEEIVAHFNRLRQTQRQLAAKLSELQMDLNEHKYDESDLLVTK